MPRPEISETQQLLQALGSLYDSASWALIPELGNRNEAAYDSLERSLDRARVILRRFDPTI